MHGYIATTTPLEGVFTSCRRLPWLNLRGGLIEEDLPVKASFCMTQRAALSFPRSESGKRKQARCTDGPLYNGTADF